MIVLGVDTCGVEGSLALARHDEAGLQSLEELTLTGRRSAGALVPALRGLLGRHALTVSQLGALVVVHGPGSFTGIRMGVSAVKGLSEASGMPVVAVSRLQVLRASHGAQSAALDAGRGDVYFGNSAGEWLLSVEEARARSEPPPVVCEAVVAEALPSACLVASPTAFDAVRSVLPRLLARDFDDIATLDGNYVRRPEYRSSAS